MTLPILNYVDRCIFLAGSAGTGPFVVSGAVLGYQTPAIAGAISGKQYGYAAQSTDLTQWEYGYGTLTIALGVTTLTRTVVAGTSGASPVNFIAPPTVLMSVLAESLPGPLSNLFDVTISNPTDGQVLVYNGSAAKWENDQRLIGSNATVSGQAGSNVLIQPGAGLGTGTGGTLYLNGGAGGVGSAYAGKIVGRGGYSTGVGGSFYFTGGMGAGNGGGRLFLSGGDAVGLTSVYGGNCGLYGGTAHGTQPLSRGGNLRMIGGYGASTSAKGGDAVFLGGSTAGSGRGGRMFMYGGNAYGSANGGNAYIGGGNAYNTGRGGNAFLYSGVTHTGGRQAAFKLYSGALGGSGVGGYAILIGGQGAATGPGGSLKIYGGAGGATSGNGGDVIIKPGATTSGTIGHFFLKNLPTSNAGLTSGMVWNNAGVLNIV